MIGLAAKPHQSSAGRSPAVSSRAGKCLPLPSTPIIPPLRHDETSCWPTRGGWTRLPSLGSKVAHTAGSLCRRSVSDRPRPPPVVHTICAPRGLLLRGDKSHKGMLKSGL